MIYLDNAATSFPKPAAVAQAMMEFMIAVGANPGRSGYASSAEAGRIVHDCREQLARLFDIPDARQLVFTKNATEAICLSLSGFLREGDEVVTTGMEHNAVMRPLSYLGETRGVSIKAAECDGQGRLDLESLAGLITERTRLVVVNHASNVTGTIQPLREISDAIGETPLLVDAAQTAGALEINVQRDRIAFLAFTGHKSLLGPQGTAGLYIREDLTGQVSPLLRGGTGSKSEEERQPEIMPDKFEAGTMNTVGVAGLGAAVRFLTGNATSAIHAREFALTQRMIGGLEQVEGLSLFGPPGDQDRMPVVSFTLEHADLAEVGRRLDREFGIACRVGLHCAPRAHRTIDTFPDGTIRLSPGYTTTESEVDETVNAVRIIAAGART